MVEIIKDSNHVDKNKLDPNKVKGPKSQKEKRLKVCVAVFTRGREE